MGWCCRVCHGLIVLRPTSLLAHVRVEMQAGWGCIYECAYSREAPQVCDLEKSYIIIFFILSRNCTSTHAHTHYSDFPQFSPCDEKRKYIGSSSICYQQGVCITARVDWISERDVRLVEATPSSAVNDCLNGWDEEGLRWKKVQQLAPLETLLYRKTGECSGLNVCVGLCVFSVYLHLYPTV